MNKYKYLFKNIVLLMLSNFSTKLLSFFLVPLYTNILSTADYGIYDLFSTTIGVLLPVLTFNIHESVMRFALDKDYDRKAIVSIGSKYLILSNMLVLAGLLVNCIFNISTVLHQYAVYFFLMFLAQSFSGVIIAYTRGIDKIEDLSVSSVISSAITIGCNILFLIAFKWGLPGYCMANIIGPLMQCVYLMLRCNIVKNLKFGKKFRYEKERKEMLFYSRPMIVNSIAWWVNSASDRYVVIFFCGLTENGIYAVASKIPSILNVFQTIFNQAWALSAVRDFDPEDRNGFFSNTYQAYNCMLVILCSLVIAFDRVLAKFLYAKDFYLAWKYVPWLTMAIIFSAMASYLGGVFTAIKNSNIFAQSSIIGALINLTMNIILVPILGALGAAVATTCSYFFVWLVRLYHARRYIKLRLNIKKDIIVYLILVLQSMALITIDSLMLLYSIEAISFFFITYHIPFNDMDIIEKDGPR